MTVKAEDAKAALVDKAAAQVRATAPSEEAPEIEAFLRRYFADAALEDLGEIDLYGAALSHWRLLQRRRRRKKFRVHLRVVEPRHRPAIQPQRPRRQNEIGPL